MEDPHEEAERAVAALAHQFELTVSVPVHNADDRETGINSRRLLLSRKELRHDISTYFGRLASPVLAAAAIPAIAAESSASSTDWPANALADELALGQHLRALTVEWEIRRHNVGQVTSVAAAAHHLWRPDRYTDDGVIALAVLELLPRVDAALLPESAVQTIKPAVVARMGIPAVHQCVRLWRQGLHGKDTTGDQWVQLARELLTRLCAAIPVPDHEIRATEPGVAAQLYGNTAAGALGVRTHHDLVAAAERVIESAHRLHASRPAPTSDPASQNGARIHPDDTGTSGGLFVGQRTILWRPPTHADHRNRRLFTRRLDIAGRRTPGVAQVPSARPRGRTNTRLLMIRGAQLAAGRAPTAKPWIAQEASPRMSERLLVAMVIDTSATMAPWIDVTAPLGWATAHAVAELGGLCTLWGFGGQAYPIIDSRRAPDQVPVIRDTGSGSDGAATAIEEATKPMLTRSGCRILVVVTDGKLPDEDIVLAAVADARAAGISVIWAMRGSGRGQDVVRPTTATVLEDQTPRIIAEVIADSIIDQLTEPARASRPSDRGQGGASAGFRH